MGCVRLRTMAVRGAIAVAELLRNEGEDPVAVSADALQLYAGLEILTGAATGPPNPTAVAPATRASASSSATSW